MAKFSKKEKEIKIVKQRFGNSPSITLSGDRKKQVKYSRLKK